MLGCHLPKGRRGQRSSTGSIGGVSEIGQSHSLEQQVAMVMEGGVAMETEGGVAMGQQIEIQQPQTQPQVATLGVCEGGGRVGEAGVGVWFITICHLFPPQGIPPCRPPWVFLQKHSLLANNFIDAHT